WLDVDRPRHLCLVGRAGAAAADWSTRHGRARALLRAYPDLVGVDRRPGAEEPPARPPHHGHRATQWPGASPGRSTPRWPRRHDLAETHHPWASCSRRARRPRDVDAAWRHSGREVDLESARSLSTGGTTARPRHAGGHREVTPLLARDALARFEF